MTVEISAPLLRAAEALAAERGTTLGDLVETGLRAILDDAERDAEVFQLRDESFEGRGLHPDQRGAEWPQIREAAQARETLEGRP